MGINTGVRFNRPDTSRGYSSMIEAFTGNHYLEYTSSIRWEISARRSWSPPLTSADPQPR